jgi:phage shock protein A
MFKAILRYIKAFGALLTGGINGARESLNRNRHVIAATYDEIKDDQVGRVQSMSKAVAGMITQKERKITKTKALTERLAENCEMRDGALAMIEELKGQYDLTTPEGVAALKSTEDYQEASGAYESLSKEIEDDEHTIEELELGIAEDEENLAGHLAELGQMKDQVEKIQNEKHETIAAVEAAKAEKEINDMMNGISQNDTGERLQEMRGMRDQLKSEVVVGRKLAGTDSRQRKAKFKKFANKRKANSEFDNLLGIGKEAEAKEGAAKEEVTTTQLPE